ncbi:hypothetical protein ACTMU2_41510 [Cupriavidus basilensis]
MVFGLDSQRSAPAANVCDMFLVAPDIYADNYIDFLVDVPQTYRISALLSLNDLELPLIAHHAERLREVGTVPVVSSAEVIHLCSDKFQTSQFAESIGLSTPRSYATLTSAEQAIDAGEVSFPLVVKPRWGSASFASSSSKIARSFASPTPTAPASGSSRNSCGWASRTRSSWSRK